MKTSKTKRGRSCPTESVELQIPADPAIAEYIKALRARYAKYALPEDEARRLIDKAMGEKTLTEILFQMRNESL
ncbi:MAG: hypothetical protein EXR47_01965 [Dehalococcoidia bacterium]|nr:hypothetical protein [Dehalococcoidia bacterium]